MVFARGTVAKLAFFFALSLALFFVAPNALAQNAKAEASASALQKKAMDDYLQTDFNKAQDKLEKASKTCEGKCGPGLRARLFRDLGVVQIGGAIDKEKGINNFVEALKIDPGVALDPDIRTKDLDAAFAEAKRRVTGGAAPEQPKPKPKPVATGDQPDGDFQHTPTAQQQIRTPIPIYLEWNGETQLVKIVARYKGFGMAEWKNIELSKMGAKGWGGLIPCADVQQGVTQYFLTGFDANNDPVATGGDRNHPYKVQVTNEKPADPPHLPDAAPPNQCQDTGDCPPNFPGCKKGKAGAEPVASEGASGKEGGEFCEEDNECRSQRCNSNKCDAYTDDDRPKGKRFWIGIAGTVDISFVPSVEDACKLKTTATPVNDQNYYCVDGAGKDYPSRDPANAAQNNAIVSSADHGSDKVSGGGSLGNIRVMLTFDYALNANIMLGARFGIVLNNYPGEAAGQDGKRFAAPIHAEARFTYVVGKDAIWKKGFAPYFMGAAGIAPFESAIGVQTIEVPLQGTAVKKSLDAWHIAGPGFISIGGGGRYAVTPRFAFLFGLRANAAFGNSFVPSIGPEVGGQFGF